MASEENTGKRVACNTEYGRLSDVIVCPPRYMQIDAVINEKQKYYSDKNIDIDIALRQHSHFIEVLKKHGVEVKQLAPKPQLYEQVFTRDVGFCIGDRLFIASLESDIRQGEGDVLEEHLDQHGINFLTFPEGPIEGGDILVDDDKVWVGLSGRTKETSVDKLKRNLPSYQVFPVTLEEEILHLDCAFNILSPEWALIYPPAFNDKDINLISTYYKVIEVDVYEQFSLAVNVLSIGDNKVISLPKNAKVNEKLRNIGFDVLEVEFSEIIKSGGSFRCCTLPLLRN